VLRGHSGLEALGGGSFEEVVRPPLGNCSINTRIGGTTDGPAQQGCNTDRMGAPDATRVLAGVATLLTEPFGVNRIRLFPWARTSIIPPPNLS
jgi:hypothetical protein